MGREEPPTKKVWADPHRIMAWVDSILTRPPVQWGLVSVMLLVLAILLSPRLWTAERLASTLSVGQRAEGNIKATRTFDYFPDEQKVEQERQAAAAQVPPVFDHQADLQKILKQRIKKAFAELTPADAGVEQAAPAPGTAPRAAMEEEWEARRKQFNDILQVETSADDFKQLRMARSVREVQGILLTLVVAETMQSLIIADPKTLYPFKNKPVVMRHLEGGRLGSAGEETISNPRQMIEGLQQVRDDLRTKAEGHTAKLPPRLAQAVTRLAESMVLANVSFNSTETNVRIAKARAAVGNNAIRIVKGQVIVRDGDPITGEDMRVMEAMQPREREYYRFQVPVGAALFLVILLVVQFRYSRRGFARFYDRPRDLLAMAVLLLGLVGLCKSVVALGGGLTRGQDLPVSLYAIPLAAGPMLVRLLISAEAAAVFASLLALVCGMMVEQSLFMALFYLVTGLVAAGGVSQVQSRRTILKAGLWAGTVGLGVVLGLRMFGEAGLSAELLYACLAAFAGGLLIAFLTLALLPAMEWLFAYTTDVTLLELANLNHPLLRELILRAPGTYHHSMIVGSLSEAACDSIGANGLLARVASYYHDIGKMKNSEYFAENFRSGDNPHNRLKPSMSALIIRNHVRDTIESLRAAGVPELVIDTGTQHHGKTLIEYFYHKAKEQHEGDEEDVIEENYRYPGPKPQSREAGVIMLADGVEAAARSLAEPTEDRLQGVVQRLINTKFTDGQLDHCDLTLRDLHLIAKSFLQVLRGIYHQRPTYPWQKRKAGEDKGRDTQRHKTESGEVETATEEGRGRKAAPGGKAEGKSREERKGKGREERKGKSGAHKAVADKSGDKDDGAEQAKDRRDPTDGGSEGGQGEDEDQPAGERPGAEGVEPGSAQEVSTDSNPDLRRLGLN
jgi:putative nucleotidyltransferase with HDIG domain